VKLVGTVDRLREELVPHRGRRIALVPTMGAFHEGHLSLLRTARAEADVVVASLFVNPAQFNEPGDLNGYPRDEERDARLATDAGVDLLFAPSADEIYPPGFQTWVEVEQLGSILEGEHRPGHFRGVATICLKLFNIVRPDVAYFGQKDAQQAAVLKQMVRDLNLELELRVLPTVRDSDGLALSSRNALLSREERERARSLHRALATKDPQRARLLLRDLDVDYVEVADFEPSVLAAAVRVGNTRLIDNVVLENPFQGEASLPGRDGRVRCKDAGSARIRSDTGATEDAAARRPARPGGSAPRSETGSTRGEDE
jgi:pantoate--beta-alanine ligase